jgi:hypothetical protein
VVDLLGWWHLLSLDAPTVAVVWLLAFAWTAGVTLPVWIPVVLACGTWGVYLLDRILDARSALKRNQWSLLRLRHMFHWRFHKVLLPLSIELIVGAFGLAMSAMPATARVRNSLLMAAALGYFSGVHAGSLGVKMGRYVWIKNLKEFFVGLIFTAACVLPTLARIHDGYAMILPVALFVALAWLNCHAIEVWESRTIDGIDSKSAWEERAVWVGALLLASFALGGAIYILHFDERFSVLELTACASALLIATLHFYRQRFSQLVLRIAADLVLLTPLIFLLRRAG